MSMQDPRTPPPYRGAPPSGPLWYTSPGPPVAPQPVPRSGGGRHTALWILLGSIALLCFVAVAAIGWWVLDAAPDHPDAWDPAVAELAAFVEQERGVEFDHPVHVEFLDADAYRKVAGGAPDDDAADEDAAGEAADVEIGMYRSLGLISGDVDLGDANSAMWSDGTAAFYDGSTDRIVVNGQPVDGELSTELELVVVHELTHALQHQVVDLEVLYGEPDEVFTTERADARLAVLEGDASLVESAYFEQLDPARHDELIATVDERAESSEASLAEAGVPTVLSTSFSMPYQLGPAWVDAALHGPDGVDIATLLSERMPTTATVLALRADGEVAAGREVRAPELPEGAEELVVDTWGAFSWVLPFASWSDADDAVEAAAAWAGDSVVVYRDDRERVCFVAAIDAASGDGAERIDAVARAWADGLDASSDASVTRDGRRVELGSCDPGSTVELTPTHDPAAALEALSLRNSIVSSGLVEGLGAEPSECFADGLIEGFGVEQLNDGALVTTPAFETGRDEVLERCGI